MNKQHQYNINCRWTGNTGEGTSSYNSYQRSHLLSAKDKPEIAGSSDPAFRGDSSKYNPEELFLCSLSSCHMLWYLHLCSSHNIIVTNYEDDATGIMEETDKGGYFTEVILYPRVSISNPAQIGLAKSLHTEANKHCFIANSVNFPVRHKPEVYSI